MKRHVAISRATIDRLPLYFRTLRNVQAEGVEIVSSEEIGRRIGVTPEQIRKDLASFGEFGKIGVCYYVRDLLINISEILGLNRNWNISIIGAGHLGWALANYKNFSNLGFKLTTVFDVSPDKVGRMVNGVEIRHMNTLQQTVKEQNIHIGIIAVPAEYAQQIADDLVDAGIAGIWNFAPIKLDIPSNIQIVNEDLSVGLSSLSFFLSHQ